MAWHWYPLGAGRSNDVIPNINDPKFTGTTIKDRLEEIQFWRNRDAPEAELWMGETGGAFNSGQNTTTNKYMSHRWYLDQLGMFAKYGHAAYCRQTLIGGNYGLLEKVGSQVNINPDFYGAVLFHNLMGDSVRNVEVIDNDQAAQNIHLYSHLSGSTGSTTVLAINFYRDEDVEIEEIDGKTEYENMNVWIVTAKDDQDNTIYINDIEVVVNDTIPDVMTMSKIASLPIKIPVKSYAFIQFRNF